MEQFSAGSDKTGQSKKSNKGKIVALIVIILALVAGGGYYAYSKLSKNSDEGSTNSVGDKVAESECKYDDKDLCKFITSWKDEKYITMKGTSTDKDGKISTWLMKMEGENKSQMVSSEEGEEKYNTITIDNTTYTKDYTDNKWFKQTSSSDSEVTNDYIKEDIDFDEKEASVEDKTTYQKIGKEKCDKWTCFKYQVIDPTNNESTQYIYFDDDEYLLRKMRTEELDGTITEITYDYSKFSISEPSPTKEGSLYDSSLNNIEESQNSDAVDYSDDYDGTINNDSEDSSSSTAVDNEIDSSYSE